MFKKSKILCLVATLLLGIIPFVTAGSSVYAAENSNSSNQEIDLAIESTDGKDFLLDAQAGLDMFFKKAVSINDLDGKFIVNEAGMKEIFGDGEQYKDMIDFVDLYNDDTLFNYEGRLEFKDKLVSLSQGVMPTSIESRRGGALATCIADWARNTFAVGLSVPGIQAALAKWGYVRTAGWIAGQIASATGKKAAAVLTLVYTAMTCAPIEAE